MTLTAPPLVSLWRKNQGKVFTGSLLPPWRYHPSSSKLQYPLGTHIAEGVGVTINTMQCRLPVCRRMFHQSSAGRRGKHHLRCLAVGCYMVVLRFHAGLGVVCGCRGWRGSLTTPRKPQQKIGGGTLAQVFGALLQRSLIDRQLKSYNSITEEKRRVW